MITTKFPVISTDKSDHLRSDGRPYEHRPGGYDVLLLRTIPRAAFFDAVDGLIVWADTAERQPVGPRCVAIHDGVGIAATAFNFWRWGGGRWSVEFRGRAPVLSAPTVEVAPEGASTGSHAQIDFVWTNFGPPDPYFTASVHFRHARFPSVLLGNESHSWPAGWHAHLPVFRGQGWSVRVRRHAPERSRRDGSWAECTNDPTLVLDAEFPATIAEYRSQNHAWTIRTEAGRRYGRFCTAVGRPWNLSRDSAVIAPQYSSRLFQDAPEWRAVARLPSFYARRDFIATESSGEWRIVATQYGIRRVGEGPTTDPGHEFVRFHRVVRGVRAIRMGASTDPTRRPPPSDVEVWTSTVETGGAILPVRVTDRSPALVWVTIGEHPRSRVESMNVVCDGLRCELVPTAR